MYSSLLSSAEHSFSPPPKLFIYRNFYNINENKQENANNKQEENNKQENANNNKKKKEKHYVFHKKIIGEHLFNHQVKIKIN